MTSSLPRSTTTSSPEASMSRSAKLAKSNSEMSILSRLFWKPTTVSPDPSMRKISVSRPAPP